MTVTYDGSRGAGGMQVYVDGRRQKLIVALDLLTPIRHSPRKSRCRIGGGNGPDGRFHGLIDEVRVYDRVLSDSEARVLATAETIGALRSILPERRTAAQAEKLRACFLERGAPGPIREVVGRVEAFREERTRLIENFPTTMVMQEMPVPRDTFILSRGEYDKPGEKVAAGIPASLSPLPAGTPNNRLGFARWLVDRSNPLTARVAVNRMWQMLFGTGIVKTVDDFGAQGEWPSHPELLDWLAVEFMSPDSRFDVDIRNSPPS